MNAIRRYWKKVDRDTYDQYTLYKYIELPNNKKIKNKTKSYVIHS